MCARKAKYAKMLGYPWLHNNSTDTAAFTSKAKINSRQDRLWDVKKKKKGSSLNLAFWNCLMCPKVNVQKHSFLSTSIRMLLQKLEIEPVTSYSTAVGHTLWRVTKKPRVNPTQHLIHNSKWSFPVACTKCSRQILGCKSAGAWMCQETCTHTWRKRWYKKPQLANMRSPARALIHSHANFKPVKTFLQCSVTCHKAQSDFYDVKTSLQ